MLFFHVFANQNPRRSNSLAPAPLRPRRFRHNDEKLVICPNFRPLLSYVYALFHFPYPVTPVFGTLTKRPQIIVNTATLSPFLATHTDIAPVSPVFATHTKTPGVHTNNSHFGSRDRRGELRSFVPFLHAGRIAKTIRSRRRNDAKKSNNCFQGTYFLLSSFIPCSASAPVTISARACTQSPSSLPLAVQGAIRTRGLFRMRFTFPETPIVYTKSFASLESSRTDGSAANHTGVFTPSPLFLNVSRFKYLCPANASNPIASLLPLRCALLYMRHKHKRQAIRRPALWSAAAQLPLFRSITRRNFSAPENETLASYFVRTYVTSSVKASFCSLRNVQVVLK